MLRSPTHERIVDKNYYLISIRHNKGFGLVWKLPLDDAKSFASMIDFSNSCGCEATMASHTWAEEFRLEHNKIRLWKQRQSFRGGRK